MKVRLLLLPRSERYTIKRTAAPTGETRTKAVCYEVKADSWQLDIELDGPRFIICVYVLFTAVVGTISSRMYYVCRAVQPNSIDSSTTGDVRVYMYNLEGRSFLPKPIEEARGDQLD